MLLGALTVAWLSACGNAPEAARSGAHDATPTAAAYHVSEYGVGIGIRVGYHEKRTVTGARLLWDDQSDDIALYPLDGSDPDEPPETVVLEPGAQVLLEGSVLAACPDPTSQPVFEVVSRYRGMEHTDRFVPHDLTGYRKAFADWCERSVTLNVLGTSVTPKGVYELRVEFSNPGPLPVKVVSERVLDGKSTWQRNTGVVLPGTIEQMTIRGHGPPECAAVPPWASGHLLADGVPITPQHDDGWC